MAKKLVNLSVEKVAGVDRPANGRRFLVIKRAGGEGPATFGEWLTRFFKQARESPAPITFDTAYASSKLDDEWWRLNDALRTSIKSIVESDAEDKAELTRTALQQYAEKMVALVNEVAKSAGRDAVPIEKLQEALIALGDACEHASANVNGDASASGLTDAVQKVVDASKALREQVEKGDGTMPTLEELLKAAPQELQDAVAKALADKDGELEALRKKVGKEPDPVDVVKDDLPEPVRKRFEELEKRAKEAEEIAKAEREKRELAEIRKRAESLQAVGDVDELAAVIKAAHDVSPEQAEKLETVLKSAAERIKQSALFSERGHGGEDPGSAYAQLMAKADEIRKNDTSLTKEQAFERAVDLYPDLVAQYRKEVR